ncbi:DUF6602 domain-containing protein [Nocardia sp. NPDC056952]|uniref:DUF6602 domain-containing protein n=1 Tax=Nocardia sp. NPDC056952 TaxID=3345979 RepID=UPI0036436694
MIHEHHEWLADVAAQMSREYEKAHAMATTPSGVQQSGHKGEAAWVDALQSWLPPRYEIGKRKYLLLEDDSFGVVKSAETDIVVFQPSYPERLRERAEVLVSGVIAAFSVKLSLDRKGIAEAVNEAALVRRATKVRSESVKDELLPPLLYGILAHSHSWKQPKSSPNENVRTALEQFDLQSVKSPREGLDLVCVADLNCWSRTSAILTRSNLGPELLKSHPDGGVLSGFVDPFSSETDESPTSISPIAVFITLLLGKLSYYDTSVRPIAEGLRVTGTGGRASGSVREWRLDEVFSERARVELRKSPWAWDAYYT